MKIYEIGTGYTPIPAQVAAATESVVEELTKAFIKKNIDVTILDISTSARAANSLPIEEVRVPSIFTKSDVSLGIIHKVKRVVYSVALAFKLKKILKKTKEKIVLHFHNQYNIFFFSNIVNKKLRDKAEIVYTNHNGYWSLPFEEVKPILESRYFQEIEGMKNSDVIFALNENTRKSVVKNLSIPEEKVFVIGNGVNTEIYRPLDATKIKETKKKFNLDGEKVILQVGSVYENKGQVRAIEMLTPLLKADKNLIYAFVGGIVSDEYYNLVLDTAKKNGVENQVKYLGTTSPGEEMNAIYNIADIMLFVSHFEGFPLVCVEALSAGVPVVLNSPNLSSFGAGSLLADDESFADEVKNIIYNESNLLSLKRSARDNATENYTWSKIAEDYYDNF